MIISTQSSEKDRLRGMSLGADEYLAKPLNVDALLSAVDRLLSGGPVASG
jgi:DNA-binding response OmpR family regulator